MAISTLAAASVAASMSAIAPGLPDKARRRWYTRDGRGAIRGANWRHLEWPQPSVDAARATTDNGRVFTGKFFAPPVEVRFDAICRERGVEHLLTLPRSPTTTGKIERFHRTLRAEFDTRQVFSSLKVAQQGLDEWVGYYNTTRPHQALNDATPAARFTAGDDRPGPGSTNPAAPSPAGVESVRAAARDSEGWVSRRVGPNGIVCVSWQQVSVGKHRAGQRCDLLVTDQLLQFWIGDELLKTVSRTSTGEVRKKHGQTPA